MGSRLLAPAVDETELLTHLIAAWRRFGASVRVGGGENLVRLRPGASPRVLTVVGDQVLPPVCDDPVLEVEAEGLPNLVHEWIHLLQSACLDDDHGFVYGRIPLDLDRPADRAVMWDELSCCVISCAYASWTRRGETAADMHARVEAWFREQIAIQPLFYGWEADPDGFLAHVRERFRAHRDEADAIVARGYRRCRATLIALGVPHRVARPPVAWTLERLLRP